jgi:CBS domain containing-hemolysin-like protein
MTVFLLVLTLMLTVLYICLLSIRLTPSTLSQFELRRRTGQRDVYAKKALAREERLADYATLLWLKTIITFFLVVITAIGAFGWGLGSLYALVVAVLGAAIARKKMMHAAGAWLWRHIVPLSDKLIEKASPVLKTLRIDSAIDSEVYRRFDSRDELVHLVKNSGSVLSVQEKSIIAHGLAFGDVQVREKMTPRAAIDTINKDEFLGPLVLDELHTTGHSRLPVTDGDIDHIIGILHINDLLTLVNKKSSTAEEAMDGRVFYIHEDDTLDHALAAFIKNRRHLFVVINDSRETVGLLSLEDVIETLIGQSIMDEDDVHDDLHAVAQQRGRSNNASSGHVDL